MVVDRQGHSGQPDPTQTPRPTLFGRSPPSYGLNPQLESSTTAPVRLAVQRATKQLPRVQHTKLHALRVALVLAFLVSTALSDSTTTRARGAQSVDTHHPPDI